MTPSISIEIVNKIKVLSRSKTFIFENSNFTCFKTQSAWIRMPIWRNKGIDTRKYVISYILDLWQSCKFHLNTATVSAIAMPSKNMKARPNRNWALRSMCLSVSYLIINVTFCANCQYLTMNKVTDVIPIKEARISSIKSTLVSRST